MLLNLKLPKFMEIAIDNNIISYPDFIRAELNNADNWHFDIVEHKSYMVFETSYDKMIDDFFEFVKFIKIAVDYVQDIWGQCKYPEAFNIEYCLENHQYILTTHSMCCYLGTPTLIYEDLFNTKDYKKSSYKTYTNTVNGMSEIINYKKLICRFPIIHN